MATHAIASIVEGNRIKDTGKSNYSTEAQVGSEEKDVSDALEISETYPNNATSGDDKITLDEAAPNTSTIDMDQQTTAAELKAVASETPKKQEKVVPKQATLHPEVSALADSLGSKLDVLANSPSIQEPECSKQSEIQSTSRAAYQTAKYELSEKISGDEEEMDSIEVQLWVAADDHDYPTDKRSPLKKGKKSSAGVPKKKKPSIGATIMNLETPQTPIKSVKMSNEAMPTSASTPDLNVDEIAQSTKKPPESSHKCSYNPPTSPMQLTTGHTETAGSATKKRVQQSRGSRGNHVKKQFK